MKASLRVKDFVDEEYPEDESPYTHALVGGLACYYCGQDKGLIDHGLISRTPWKNRRGWAKRRRLYLCPECLRSSVRPLKVGKKREIGRVQFVLPPKSDRYIMLAMMSEAQND